MNAFTLYYITLHLQHVFSLDLFHSLMRVNYFLIIIRNFHILYSQCRSAEDQCYFLHLLNGILYKQK